MGTSPGTPAAPAFCTECGRPYPPDDLATFGSRFVCAACKPAFVQRMREGVPLQANAIYGGFWRRGAALFLDGLILMFVIAPVQILLSVSLSHRLQINPGEPPNLATLGPIFGYVGLVGLLSMGVHLAYQVFFLTRKGATPGKMALGLKVVTATGGPISTGLAVGRYFALILDSITMGIGYIIAAFDDQKRALHDHICSTRVVRAA